MSKRVIIVSKTHLDLGFTDYAENIKNKYINDFIPKAINIAQEVNSVGKTKRFVWTCGSWLINEALNCGDKNIADKVNEAIVNGDILAHAMPFTTHTELLDGDSLEYGLSLIDRIDVIRGKKTVSAKMTDVPGHTIAIVPYLARKGIKLLHIGVNGASALPKVPPCFLWRIDGYEIIVIYSGDYGGEFRCEYIDDILYFDHTLDNRGTRSSEQVINNYNRVAAKYPDYETVAGSMDDIADKLWSVKDKLPLVTQEIGDTWIHGAATDPYKVGAMRELQRLKYKWLEDGSLIKGGEEYKSLCDKILCTCEHTWGMDMKCYFADYENYLRKDFDKARAKDIVKIRHVLRDFPQNFINYFAQLFGINERGSYKAIERSWSEQRAYTEAAVASMSSEHVAEACQALDCLLPKKLFSAHGTVALANSYTVGDYSMTLNAKGNFNLTYKSIKIVSSDDKSPLEYNVYGDKDYQFWFDNYTRDINKTRFWAYGDFGRPLYKYADKHFNKGRVAYNKCGVTAETSPDAVTIVINYKIDKYYTDELGAPRDMQIIYKLSDKGLKIGVIWLNKAANRITESIHYRLYPVADKGSLRYSKLNCDINPYDITEYGNRNLSCVDAVKYKVNNYDICINNYHSPLVGLGEGKILKFDNKYEDVASDGISYILFDNVWGTNFPLWYEDNAYFEYEINANYAI